MTQAALSPVQRTALQLHAFGANVNAIAPGGKGPAHKWKHLCARRQTEDEVKGLPWHKAAGVGAINGPGGVRTLDIDPKKEDEQGNKLAPDQIAPVAASVLFEVLRALGVPIDYPWAWRSGSGKGWEIAFLCHDDLPAGVLSAKDNEPGVFWGLPVDSTAFGHIELRWEHCQTIYPPSAYCKPDGPGYQWRGAPPDTPPAVVSVEQVLNAFFTVAAPKQTEPKRKAAVKTERRATAPPAVTGDVIADIKQRLNLVDYAHAHWPGDLQKEPDGQIRICGHGGLLIDEDDGQWYCFGWGAGGDALDLVGRKLYEDRWDNTDGVMFRTALEEAARETSVTLPELTHGMHTEQGSALTVDAATPAGQEIERLRQENAWLRATVAQLQSELEQVRERNRFVTQTHGAEGIATPSMRLTFIELKKELDRVPVEEREAGRFVRIRPAYMAKCSNQHPSNISRHLAEFEKAGLIEKKVDRTYNAETDEWYSETAVRPLVDLSDPSKVVIPRKPRGKQACKNCGKTNIVRQVRISCPDCGLAEWSDPELVNQEDVAADLQIANQETQPVTEEGEAPPACPELQNAKQRERTVDHSLYMPRCNSGQHPADNLPISSQPLDSREELQVEIIGHTTPGPAPLAIHDPRPAPGVQRGLIAADDPWFEFNRQIAGGVM
ncbi:MAG: bifunctional DNA primase/polymerase [Chloroflexota bacterium]|nr:bifunctional DNA primase/polymerase [Chloroflexota bacterium]